MSLFTNLVDPLGILGRVGSVLPEPAAAPPPPSTPVKVLWIAGLAILALVLWRIIRRRKGKA